MPQPSRLLTYSDRARQAILAGVEKLARAVCVTLGPGGRNVLYESFESPLPIITKDGVTVAKQVYLKDPLENLGASLVREVALKTNDSVGDGTTTSVLLAYEILKEGLLLLSKGAVPANLKRGIELGVEQVVNELKQYAIAVDAESEMIQLVAGIASNNDAIITKLVTNAMKSVGKDGIVMTEETKSAETSVEVVKGVHFGSGFIAPHFITNPQKGEVLLKDCYILLVSKEVSNILELKDLMNEVAKTNKSILVIADDVSGEALAFLIYNKMQGRLRACAVRTPSFAEELEDISIVTGAEIIAEHLGTKISQAGLTVLGHADQVVVRKDATVIVNGKGDKQRIEDRITLLEETLNQETREHLRRSLKFRIAKLKGGIGVIKVGALTETELKEKKDRIDDALCATKAALEEGIVAGGGALLARLTNNLTLSSSLKEDEIKGIKLVKKVLTKPLEMLLLNSGRGERVTDIMVEEVSQSKVINYGIDIRTGQRGNMIKMGIVDPVKVVRLALQNAASVAALLLTTETVIAFDREKEK